MNIKSSDESTFVIGVRNFFKLFAPSKTATQSFVIMLFVVLSILVWHISGLLTFSIIVGLIIYHNDDDDDISSILFYVITITVVFFVLLGSVNVYNIDESAVTIPAEVIDYEVDDSENIIIVLSDKFKPNRVELDIDHDTVLYDIGKRFGQPWTAKITRKLTYDHQDKIFHDSKPSGHSYFIRFTIGDLDLGKQMYEQECKDYMCSELFRSSEQSASDTIPLKEKRETP